MEGGEGDLLVRQDVEELLIREDLSRRVSLGGCYLIARPIRLTIPIVASVFAAMAKKRRHVVSLDGGDGEDNTDGSGSSGGRLRKPFSSSGVLSSGDCMLGSCKLAVSIETGTGNIRDLLTADMQCGKMF